METAYLFCVGGESKVSVKIVMLLVDLRKGRNGNIFFELPGSFYDILAPPNCIQINVNWIWGISSIELEGARQKF